MVIKDKDYIKNFLLMATNFYDTMKIITEPPTKSIFNFFKRGKYVSREVLDYYHNPLWDIYNYILQNNLMPVDMNWKLMGYCLFWFTQEKITEVRIPQGIKDFAIPRLQGRKLCIEKDKDDIYAVVFLE